MVRNTDIPDTEMDYIEDLSVEVSCQYCQGKCIMLPYGDLVPSKTCNGECGETPDDGDNYEPLRFD